MPDKKSTKRRPSERRGKKAAQSAQPAPRRSGKLSSANLAVLHVQPDLRIGSHSVLVDMDTQAYLRFVKDAYENRGGIEGQRDQLQTSSAKRIRQRMAEDVIAGAILPSLVVGVMLSPKSYKELSDRLSSTAFIDILNSISRKKSVSIIDGMQRTSVLLEVQKHLADRRLRVEFWVSSSTSNLSYRMLILNTGQIPWNLRRQIEVINAALIQELSSELVASDMQIFQIDDKRRRAKPGEYQAHDVVEMYLAFGLRKASVDKEAVLADQFSRLDMIEALSHANYLDQFRQVFQTFISLDKAFGRLKSLPDKKPGIDDTSGAEKKPNRTKGTKTSKDFTSGRKIFDSVPACVGFMAAASQIIFGRSGSKRPAEKQEESLQKLIAISADTCKRMNAMSERTLEDFIDLTTLSEAIVKPVPGTSLGDSERSFFTEAFRILLTEGDQLETMTPCWRSL